MKKLIKLCLLLLVVIATTSCSAERRTLRDMQTLTYNIERHGEHYTAADWKDAVEDYKQIAQDSKRCNFNAQQKEEMGELEGRCLAGFARWAGDKAVGVVKEGKGLIRGLLEGLGIW